MDLKISGVIKELAPIKGAETDEILGVNEFQTKYFLNNPLYHDPKWEFCAALGIILDIKYILFISLVGISDDSRIFYIPQFEWSITGNKSLWKQSLSTWNPFQLYSDYQILKKRMESQVRRDLRNGAFGTSFGRKIMLAKFNAELIIR